MPLFAIYGATFKGEGVAIHSGRDRAKAKQLFNEIAEAGGVHDGKQLAIAHLQSPLAPARTKRFKNPAELEKSAEINKLYVAIEEGEQAPARIAEAKESLNNAKALVAETDGKDKLANENLKIAQDQLNQVESEAKKSIKAGEKAQADLDQIREEQAQAKAKATTQKT